MSAIVSFRYAGGEWWELRFGPSRLAVAGLAYSPSLDFSDGRNSQYALFPLLGW